MPSCKVRTREQRALKNGQQRIGAEVFIDGIAHWTVRCFCGSVRTAQAWNVIRSKSCGCLNDSINRAAHTKHGYKHTAIYRIWSGMLTRVRNPNTDHAQHYILRGISVCKRWEKFENFLADMGDRPSPDMELGRIDNDGDYCPENCRWETRIQQANNTTKNVRLTFGGRTMTIREWERYLGLKKSTLKARVARGWGIERALTEKPRRDARWHE